MKRTFKLMTGAWLLLAAPALGRAALAPAEPSLPALFDGRKGPLPPPAAPKFEKSSDPAPDIPADIVEAAKVWSNEAQAASLRGRNPGPRDSFSFAVVGDVEPGRFPWQRIFAPGGAFPGLMKEIHAKSPDLIVQLGDFVSLGTAKNYRSYLSALAETVSLPMWHVIGNHDRSDPHGEADKSLYLALFGKADFYYDHGGGRFIALNSADERLTGEQLSWLSDALHTPLKKFIFMHIPPIYLKGRLKSLGGGEFSAEAVSGYFSQGSEMFEELVSNLKADRVYMGHIHAFGVADHRGVRYILTGGGGSPLYPLPPGYPSRKMAHFIETRVGPEGLRDTVFPLDEDSFELPPLKP